jgi:hypothetical protein
LASQAPVRPAQLQPGRFPVWDDNQIEGVLTFLQEFVSNDVLEIETNLGTSGQYRDDFIASSGARYLQYIHNKSRVALDRWKKIDTLIETGVGDVTKEVETWKSDTQKMCDQSNAMANVRMCVAAAVAETLMIQVVGIRAAPRLRLNYVDANPAQSCMDEVKAAAQACVDQKIEWATMGELSNIVCGICK